MEKSALTNITEKLTQPEKNFVSDLKHLAGEARRQAYRSADHLLVVRNWLIGWRIVTQEQNGKERAKYGKHVIQLASQTLTEEFGRGFGLTSIKNMRSFYLMFSKLQIGQALLDQFKLTDEPIRQAPLDESTIPFSTIPIEHERTFSKDKIGKKLYLFYFKERNKDNNF